MTLVWHARSEVDSATPVNIHLFCSAHGWGFSPENIMSPGPVITVRQADLVNLSLTSADFQIHDFFLDYDRDAMPDNDEPQSIDFQNETINYQFEAKVPGEFKYYSTFRFTSNEDDRRGSFIVKMAPTPGPWRIRQPVPTPRSDFAIAELEGEIYCIGGRSKDIASDEYYSLDSNEVYDPLTGIWTSKRPMPLRCHGCAAGVVNGRIYVIGGFREGGGPVASVQEYDPATNVWTAKTGMPTARYNHAVAVLESKVYIFGGYEGQTGNRSLLSTVEEYDPSNDLWKTKAPMPTARARLAVTVIGRKFYVIGGMCADYRYADANEVYDVSTDLWSTMAPMPGPRAYLAACAVYGRVYAIQGATNEEYDPTLDTWISRSPMPTARIGLGVVAIGPKIYAVGGGVGWANEEYTPAEDPIADFPLIIDPTPGYEELSEYLIGSVAVCVVFLESNGTIDPQTENWTSYEESQMTGKIRYALDWWSKQNPYANVSFILDVHYRVPTGYEPINHPSSEDRLWTSEAMSYLGYNSTHGPQYQVRDFLNELRHKHATDWAFAMFVVDSSNDVDGMFSADADNRTLFAYARGDFIVMTYDNDGWGIDRTDNVCAHETGHIFGASDEYNNETQHAGYLNVSDLDGSDCLMNGASWRLCGKPQGLNGTWGQLGWRDSNNNKIQDIVDTLPRIYLKRDFTSAGNVQLTFTGRATVTSYPRVGYGRSVTIKKIEGVKFRIDKGEWKEITLTPNLLEKRMGYPEFYVQKETYAIVNFTFSLTNLDPGNHTLEVKVVDSWGNERLVTYDVVIVHDIGMREMRPSRTVFSNETSIKIDVTIENQGNFLETVIVSVKCALGEIGMQTSDLSIGEVKTLVFRYNTTGAPVGNFKIEAEINKVQGETDLSDNILSAEVIISLEGDVNADGKVDILDVSAVATMYMSTPASYPWNPNADLNEDGIINILDISTVAKDYQKTA